MFFLRKSKSEPLAITMCGVRMGERALQIGIDDPSLVGTIAARVGLSGHAAIAVVDDRAAEEARAAAAEAGVLVDVQVTTVGSLPFSDDGFDVVVLHAVTGALPPLDGATGREMLREVHRVLRAGGRVMILEEGQRQRTWLRSRSPQLEASAAPAALGTAGFRAARHLANREGYSFVEGLK